MSGKELERRLRALGWTRGREIIAIRSRIWSKVGAPDMVVPTDDFIDPEVAADILAVAQGGRV